MDKRYALIGAVLIAVFFISFFLIPSIPQTLVAPSSVTCPSGVMRIYMLDRDIRSDQIGELTFSHDSSIILDSQCADLWQDLKNGQSVPVLQSAHFASKDITDYISAVTYPPGTHWSSGAGPDNLDALVQHLKDTYGILDSKDYIYNYDFALLFWEGNCNSDVDCEADEYCMVAENNCIQLECNDGDICTLDTVENHQCIYTDIADCCHDDSECPEDKVCTNNVCTEGCRNIPDRPCPQAKWLDYPECRYDESPCDVAFWAVIFISAVIIIIVGGIIAVLWWFKWRR